MTVNRVLRLVSDQSGYPVEAFIEPNRSKPLSHWRQLAYWIAFTFSTETVAHLGTQFHRDRKTVWYGIDRMEKLIKTDPVWFKRKEEAAKLIAAARMQ